MHDLGRASSYWITNLIDTNYSAKFNSVILDINVPRIDMQILGYISSTYIYSPNSEVNMLPGILQFIYALLDHVLTLGQIRGCNISALSPFGRP